MSGLDQFSQEYIDYDEGPGMVAACIVVGLLSLVVVGLRLWARKIKGMTYGLEDWLIIACVPLVIGTVICAICAVYIGRVGRHYDVNMIVDPPSYGRSQAALFAVESVYGVELVVVKFSILAMYWRIFPTPFVKRGCMILGSVTVLWIVAVAFVAFLQCTPIEKIWLPDTPGHCIDNNKFFIGNAVPNIVVDFCIMLLPAYEVSRLHMAASQKISLGCIFLLGIFVSVISGVRLVYLFRLSAGGDKTVLITIPWILTVVEGECAVICACLPLLRPVVQMLFGRVLTSGKSSHKLSGMGDFKSGTATIGGGNRSRNTRSAFKGGDSFGRLESDEASLVGCKSQCRTQVGGSKELGDSNDDIPLESIAVRHDVRVTYSEV